MLSAVSTPVLIGGIAVLVVHFPLLTFALYKLFLLRPKKAVSVLVNILLVLLVVVGPAAFLVWFFASGGGRARALRGETRICGQVRRGRGEEVTGKFTESIFRFKSKLLQRTFLWYSIDNALFK